MTDYLEFPHQDSTYPAVYSIGRMTIAWSGLEHSIFILFSVLMASENPIAAYTEDGNPKRKADLPGAIAIYYSQDSSRARRQLVVDLAKSRNNNNHICEPLKNEIISSMESAKKLARVRNEYAHTPIKFLKNGKIELIASDTIIGSTKRVRPVSEIDEHTNKIRSLAKKLKMLWFAVLEKPFEDPKQ